MSALFPYTADYLIFICIYIRDAVVDVMGRLSNSNLLLIWGPKSIEIDDSGTSQNLFWKSQWCVGLVHPPSVSHVVETTIHIKKYNSLFLSAYEFYILLWQKSHCLYSLECRTSFLVSLTGTRLPADISLSKPLWANTALLESELGLVVSPVVSAGIIITYTVPTIPKISPLIIYM